MDPEWCVCARVCMGRRGREMTFSSCPPPRTLTCGGGAGGAPASPPSWSSWPASWAQTCPPSPPCPPSGSPRADRSPPALFSMNRLPLSLSLPASFLLLSLSLPPPLFSCSLFMALGPGMFFCYVLKYHGAFVAFVDSCWLGTVGFL